MVREFGREEQVDELACRGAFELLAKLSHKVFTGLGEVPSDQIISCAGGHGGYRGQQGG